MSTKRHLIIVAGGKGLRMKSDTPKQFIELAGKPVVMHSVDRFTHAYPDIYVILVLPASQIDSWKALCRQHKFETPHKVVKGGATRFASSAAGLKAVEGDEGVVGIHDAVRPLINEKTIRQAYETAAKDGAAVPVIEVKDSIRKIKEDYSEAVDRKSYKIVQTPQCFRTDILKDAFHIAGKNDYSDDASVVENAGHPITLIEGSMENIKITRPFDLKVAETLLKMRE